MHLIQKVGFQTLLECFFLFIFDILGHVSYLSPSPLKPPQGGNKTQDSNTIMSTSFVLKFWSNEVIDVDIIFYIDCLLKVAH